MASGTSPPIKIEPLVGASMPSMQLISVVLPAPLGPMSPSISPLPTVKLTLSRARKLPDFVRNSLVRSLISKAASSV